MVCPRRRRELFDLARTANDCTSTTTHFVSSARDHVRHIIADRLSSSGHIVRSVGHAVHDVGDASCDGLETIGGCTPKGCRRIGDALTKFRSQPRRTKIEREACADRAAGKKPHQEAGAAVRVVILNPCSHFWFSMTSRSLLASGMFSSACLLERMLEANNPVGLFRVTLSFGWNVVLLGARFVALLHPKMMTGTALEPPLATA